MTGFHPGDPPGAAEAVARLVPLVARGMLSPAEADRALAMGDQRSGWQARRRWALGDGVGAFDMAWDGAARALRRRLAPLLAARATRAELERAAGRACGPLLAAERAALLAAEVAHALRQPRG